MIIMFKVRRVALKIMMHNKRVIKRKKMMTWTNKVKHIEPQIIKTILLQNLSFRMINLKMKI